MNSIRKNWRFDTSELTATHESGLVVAFHAARDEPGALDGKIQGAVPKPLLESSPAIIAKLLRQAGDGMAAAIEAEPKH